jgi:hypothetical protein
LRLFGADAVQFSPIEETQHPLFGLVCAMRASEKKVAWDLVLFAVH